MTKTAIIFEIYDITTNELLATDLPFDELPELITAYQLFYPMHQIEAAYREVTVTERVHHLPRQQFKTDWFELIDSIIDNIER